LAFGISLSAREGEDIKVAQFLSYFVEIPFEGAIAFEYGKIRADLQKAGTPIGQLDMMIAATALHHNLILVTRNTREFSRVKGLELEDWQI
jgi:tRNA(fMet)-specific endonuclease VapC